VEEELSWSESTAATAVLKEEAVGKERLEGLKGKREEAVAVVVTVFGS